MTRAIPQIDLAGLKSEPGKALLRPHIRVGCSIYPHADNPIFTGRSTQERIINWDRTKTEGTITSFNWSKKMGEPAATWSMVVKLGRDASISPSDGDVMDGDWIDIQVMRNGVVFPLCRGVIDTVTDSGVSARGARVSTISIVGRDHGGLFMTPIAWNNIFVQSFSELSKGLYTEKMTGGPGGTPAELFKMLVDATFAQGTSPTQSAWMLPPALASKTNNERFGGELHVVNDSPTRGYYSNEMQLWTQAGQNLHQTLGTWCNPLLNEFWCDLEAVDQTSFSATGEGDKIQAQIRERPFVNTTDGMSSPWFSLLETRIPSWLIDSDQLARSGRERFTMFQITADFNYGNAQEQAALGAPLWSPEDVAKYGVRPYMESTKYINRASIGDWAAEKDDWQRLVADWFAPNPYWLSGTLNLATMLPEIRIGERVRVDTGNVYSDLTAYVEGVEHTFEFTKQRPRSRTKLTLSRGFRGTDDELLRMVQITSGRFKAGFGKDSNALLGPGAIPRPDPSGGLMESY